MGEGKPDAVETFTNADFMRVVSKIAARLGGKGAELAYGSWNPDFCLADASWEAINFFGVLATEAEHWRKRGAIAAGSRRAKTPQAVECEASQSGGDKPHRPNAVTQHQSGDRHGR